MEATVAFIEVRRENLDAGEAGFRVGYEDQSHFSRDYRRQFGQPPIRDVERLREAAGV